MNEMKGILLPSLRARMGDWWYYITTMTFQEVASRVVPVDQIHEKQELKTWIQRTIKPIRLKQIATYLTTHEQRFFNGIVVGIYGGEPEWFEVEIGENPALTEIKIDEKTENSIGLLKLNGTEELFAIDGQHRVEGIKKALKQDPELKNEQQCIIFVGHKKTNEGRERTRRLFSTLNKYAVRVSPGELVALSEDDTFAVVVRKLIDNYPPLNKDFVPITPTTNIPKPDRTCITTVLGLYSIVQTLACPKTQEGSQRCAELKTGPPNQIEIENIFTQQIEFWELLRKFVPEVEKVTNAEPNTKLAKEYRNDDGGHVLFRPFGQKAFVNAARILIDRGMEMEIAVSNLSRVPMKLNETPWAGILWNPTAKKVIWGNDTLAQNLFLYMIRQNLPPKSRKENYNLEKAYQKALDNPNAKISEIPRIPKRVVKPNR